MMPFGYFGAKHGLARFYSPPHYQTVVEPFAGSAGYSCYWARQGLINRVILVDTNPAVTTLWQRLQRLTVEEVQQMCVPALGTYSTDPLFSSGGEQGMAMMSGKQRKITTRMQKDWPSLQRRLILMLPLIKHWEVMPTGDYSTIRNLTATWFIDPPYTNKIGSTGLLTAGGASYHYGFNNHDTLAKWVNNRRGHVIVCEQEPANWLPFKPFRKQRNGVGRGTGSTRNELVYERLPVNSN